MGKLKIGDRFRVKNGLKGGKRYNDLFFSRYMEKFCGKVFQVSGFNGSNHYETDATDGYVFNDAMIEPFSTNNSIHITISGPETTAVLKEDGMVTKRAVAKCNPTDTFDFNIGAKLAFDRLMGVVPTLAPQKTIVKQDNYSVGDKVKLVSKRPGAWSEKGFMDEFLGKEVIITSITDSFFKFKGSSPWSFQIKDIEGKVIDVELDKPIQKEFSEIKIGDKLKIVKEGNHGPELHVGDIHTVTGRTCFGELRTDKHNIFRCSHRDEFIVISDKSEIVKPSYREVKRQAKDGEYVKVINAFNIPQDNGKDCYKNGDIIKIIEGGCQARFKDGTGSNAYEYVLIQKEYVVLEGYQPTNKTYTQSEVDELIKVERNRIYTEVEKIFKGDTDGTEF